MERRTRLLAIVVLALVIRLLYLFQIAHSPFFFLRLGDAAAYHQWALRIVGGDWRGKDVFYQAPLYPYFLAVVYTVLGQGVATVRFVHAVIGAASCALLAAAGIELFGAYGIVAGVLLAIYPPAIFLDGLLDKTALVTLFVCALLFVLSRPTPPWRALLAGVFLGLLSLARENSLILTLPVALWFFYEDRTWQRAAAFLVACAIVLLPAAVHNYAAGGGFAVTTAQFGPNFYIGNHENARGLYEPLVEGRGNAGDEQADAAALASRAAGRKLSPAEVSSYWTGRALGFIRAHPIEWIEQLAHKLALTFNADEIVDTESQDVYAEWSSLLRVLMPLSFGVIFCLAAFGACLTAKIWRRIWLLYALIGVYTLSVIIFFVFARYRLPLVPMLALLAAGGVATWGNRAARPMRGWALLALIVAGYITYRPMVDTRIDRVAGYVNIANAMLDNQKTWDQAQAFYDKALHESPQSPAAHFGIGTLLALKNQPGDAIPHYRIAEDGWPGNADIHLNLARALAANGDPGGAMLELQEASRLRPDDPTAAAIARALTTKP